MFFLPFPVRSQVSIQVCLDKLRLHFLDCREGQLPHEQKKCHPHAPLQNQ